MCPPRSGAHAFGPVGDPVRGAAHQQPVHDGPGRGRRQNGERGRRRRRRGLLRVLQGTEPSLPPPRGCAVSLQVHVHVDCEKKKLKTLLGWFFFCFCFSLFLHPPPLGWDSGYSHLTEFWTGCYGLHERHLSSPVRLNSPHRWPLRWRSERPSHRPARLRDERFNDPLSASWRRSLRVSSCAEIASLVPFFFSFLLPVSLISSPPSFLFLFLLLRYGGTAAFCLLKMEKDLSVRFFCFYLHPRIYTNLSVCVICKCAYRQVSEIKTLFPREVNNKLQLKKNSSFFQLTSIHWE